MTGSISSWSVGMGALAIPGLGPFIAGLIVSALAGVDAVACSNA
jgi:hypothetical protein